MALSAGWPADFAYYPPVPQACALDWTGSRTVPRIGWEWALLGLSPHPGAGARAGAAATLLVAMGGSDPHGLTLRAAKALARAGSGLPRPLCHRHRHEGRAEGRAPAIVALKQQLRNHRRRRRSGHRICPADLALCAFGVTAYELAAFGVPALYLGLTEDHAAFGVRIRAGGHGRFARRRARRLRMLKSPMACVRL